MVEEGIAQQGIPSARGLGQQPLGMGGDVGHHLPWPWGGRAVEGHTCVRAGFDAVHCWQAEQLLDVGVRCRVRDRVRVRNRVRIGIKIRVGVRIRVRVRVRYPPHEI